MAVTYPLSLPDTTSVQAMRIDPRSAVAITVSPFTGQQVVYAHQLMLWSFELVLRRLPRADAEPWLAFIMALNGREGTFLFGDPHGQTPRGTASSTPGTPLVNGASQTGRTLAIDGCPNDATGYLELGDWIQLGSGSAARLYKNVTQADTNGSGEVTLDIWPRLYTSPGAGDPVTVSATEGVFRQQDNTPNINIDPEHFYNIRIRALGVV